MSNPGVVGPRTGGLNPGIAKRPTHSDPLPRWRAPLEKGIARKSNPIPRAVAATGVKGSPNVRNLQPATKSFFLPRPEAAFSYGNSMFTGGWATFGNPVSQTLNNTGFGNVRSVSATFNPSGAAAGFSMAR